MLEEVFVRVPVNLVWCLRPVCKSWDALLTHPRFASKLLKRSINTQQNGILFSAFCQSYLRKYLSLFRLNQQPRILLDINPTSPRRMDLYKNLNFLDCSKECVVAGSINGIICLASYSLSFTRFVALWNPSINYWKPIHLPCHKPLDDRYASIGLAFDSLTNDYKIIRLASRPSHTSRIDVYSANQDSWSSNSEIPFFTTQPNCSLILKGVPYWSRNFKYEDHRYDDFQSNFIASIDPHTGSYKEISYPQIALNKKTSVHPFNLMDSLALLIYSPGEIPNQTIHIYALNDENSSAITWINIYSTSAPTILQREENCILKCFEDAGKIVVVGWNEDQVASFLYDLKNNCVIDSTGMDVFRPRWDESYHHVESLVCIPEMKPIRKPIRNEEDSLIRRSAANLIGRSLVFCS